ncbi:DUF5132 domain-containing protein [Streptomyces sp. NBC_00151]|jgi:hypothetical protein|uniref:DUF5132 domain-containing protein n=1 Tax=Streptomyces sp. NBC_00151 TaxID=2975669 RepID=UPI002DDBC0CC|nr:DUF5132 domain-containing protein [Streptomyces sp. NBC_00151]WRZ38282.1 DUF5132 domain-containing protein [Streptomyces sp. NBC_00151]
MPPVVPPFLIGLIVAPLAKRVLKPLMRGVVTTSVGLVMEVKKAAQEAGENIHDLAVEVAAEMVAAQIVSGDDQRPAEGAASNAEKDEARTPKIRANVGAAKA